MRVEVWIDNLNIPWSLVFLPDGKALLSERPGQIRLIKHGVLQEEPYAEPGATHYGELIELLKKNKVKVGLARDVCSGAGHPIIDLMEK